MARPTVRTARVERLVLELVHEVFGTAAHAYKNLGVSSEVSFAVFVRAWKGDAVQPRVARAIERGWRTWGRALLARMAAGEQITDAAKEA